MDDRLAAQLRLTRARALRAGEDLKAATAEFVALAAESAGWDDDPGSHAMIAAETAVLLGESGEFGRGPRSRGPGDSPPMPGPRATSSSATACANSPASRPSSRAPTAWPTPSPSSPTPAGSPTRPALPGTRPVAAPWTRALAYEHGRVNAYAGEYEDALTALEKALALLGEPGPEDDRAGEWAECVRLAGAVEGLYLERPAPALTRLDAAVSRLTALGHTEETEPLTSLAARLRDEE